MQHPLITSIKKGYNDVALLMIQDGLGNVAEELKLEYANSYAQREVEHKNAMHVAIESANGYEIVASLLLYGFDPNTNKALSNSGSNNYYLQDQSIYVTPLLQAIEHQKLDIAELLLQYGAEVDKISQSYSFFEDLKYSFQRKFSGTPLLKAVDDNYIEGVLFLLKFDANPVGVENLSPLDRAIQKGYPEIADILFNASINSKQ